MANLGRTTKVDPIRLPKQISSIKRLLRDSPRNLAIFTMGINTALRASDLLRIKLADVEHLSPGEHFTIREKKTGKTKQVTLNKASYLAVKRYLKVRRNTHADAPLFLSRQGGNCAICVRHLNDLVKSWAKKCGIKGRYGSHSLRKPFGYMQRTQFNSSAGILPLYRSNLSSTLKIMKY